MPLPSLRQVALLVFDGVQVLDVSGPAAVFGAANDAAGHPVYKVHILSAHGGAITSSCGLVLVTAPLSSVRPASLDTMLVAGGSKNGLKAFADHDATRDWVTRASTRARRYGSICTGVFMLAQCGLLRKKRVATHWEATGALGRCYPDLEVDPNAVYVEDDGVWTSAGVTTGIDMCLALVARDLGDALANVIARRLVLYARRPGYQSQFSPVLAAQAKDDHRFADLTEWMRERLAEPLGVERLAGQAGMSPRNFHRRFTQAMGDTPASFVETLRLDHGRQLLQSTLKLKQIAAQTGYANPGQFSKAFTRRFGLGPALFREMHGDGAQRTPSAS